MGVFWLSVVMALLMIAVLLAFAIRGIYRKDFVSAFGFMGFAVFTFGLLAVITYYHEIYVYWSLQNGYGDKPVIPGFNMAPRELFAGIFVLGICTMAICVDRAIKKVKAVPVAVSHSTE